MTTNYSHYERVKAFWLCADGALIEEPNVEATPQHRRARIAGHQETFLRRELNERLYRWVHTRARARDTWPVLKLPHNPETNDDSQRFVIIRSQVERFEPRQGFEPATKNDNRGQANWLFKHPDLPIHARVQLEVVTHNAHNARVECLVKFPNLVRGGDSALGRYDRRAVLDQNIQNTNLNAVANGFQYKDEFRTILEDNGIDLKTVSHPNVTTAMTDAIKRYRQIDALDELQIPDLRGIRIDGSGHIGAMKLKFLEAQQPSSFLNEMQEFAERLAPADKIVEHWRAIVGILNQQGVPITAPTAGQVLDILAGKDEGPTTLIPLRHRGGSTQKDQSHAVTLDLHSGIVYVSCSVRETNPEQDLLAYELARERAAITGETDLMDAFLASLGRTRTDLERLDYIDAARPSRREA